jgi:NAD(P) transhydrogenase subunit alpha
VVKHGVTLVGETNLPALVAADASALYARNVLDFLKLISQGRCAEGGHERRHRGGLPDDPGRRSSASPLAALQSGTNPLNREASHGHRFPTITNLIIFVLAIYVGYHVVWTVTPALHTPLMAVTNAISAIVIVGAMLAAALTETTLGKTMGVLAVALAAVNVFGGFLVTRRMLEMFKKKDKKAASQAGKGAAK